VVPTVGGRGGWWLDDRALLLLAGVLNPPPLAPEIDSAVLIGYPAAQKYLGFDGHPSQIYVRATTDRVNVVHDLLGPTANPENPTKSPSASPPMPSSRKPTPKAR